MFFWTASTDLREVVRPSPRIAILRIPAASERDSGDYICIATSPAGTIEEQFGIRVDRGDGGGGDIGKNEFKLIILLKLLTLSSPAEYFTIFILKLSII